MKFAAPFLSCACACVLVMKRKAPGFAGTPGLTSRAAAKVVQAVQEDPSLANDFGARGHQKLGRAMEEDISLETAYGKAVINVEMPAKKGAAIPVTLINTFALLNLMVGYCPDLGKALRKLCQERPTEPLTLVVYNDGVKAGNLLKQDQSRYCELFYFSFLELGFELLSKDKFWFLAACVRVDLVKQIAGGLSAVFSSIIYGMFGRTFNFETSGCIINASEDGQQPFVLRAKLGMIIADAAAHQYLFDFKGSSSLKPCPCCKNVADRSHRELGEHDQYIVHVACTDPSRFDRHTDQTVWEMVDALAEAQRNTPRQVAHLEKVFGVNYNPQGILADKFLRAFVLPMTLLFWDPAHVFLQGVCLIEIFHFLVAVKACWHTSKRRASAAEHYSRLRDL